MGNRSSSSGSLVSRLTLRRRQEDEYTKEDIKDKFDRMPRLSEEEIKVLKSSWKMIQKKMEECGAETFLRMFQTHPDTKAVFRKFDGIDLVALEQSMELKDHGERVMMIVGKVVHALDHPKKIWSCLLEVGKQHYGYGAVPMYFDMMGPHFVISVRSCLGNDWYEALEYHWLALFNQIIYVMQFGWNLQRAEEQREARKLTKRQASS